MKTKLEALNEALQTIEDLVRQHCSEFKENTYCHGFLGANEGAFDTLKDYGWMDGEWRFVPYPDRPKLETFFE